MTTITDLPNTLRPLAVAWSRGALPSTHLDRRDAIKAAAPDIKQRAGLTLPDAETAILHAAAAIRAARVERRTINDERIVERIGYCPVRQAKFPVYRREWSGAVKPMERRPVAHGTPSTKPRAVLPRGTITSRLAAMREKAVRIAFSAAGYRSATHGDLSYHLTTDPAAVGVRQEEYADRSIYRGKYKGWSARVQNTAITVPIDWRLRVQRRGLAVVDGMLTLDAAPLAGAPDGVDLYAATWLEQGRGTALSAHDGYIARQDDMSYHGDTIESALAGLKRKLRAAEWDAVVRTADVAELITRVRDPHAIEVCVADARRIGACEYGIRSWCNAVDLDYDAGCATLAEVWDAYQRQLRSEAKATILAVLRKHRRAIAA